MQSHFESKDSDPQSKFYTLYVRFFLIKDDENHNRSLGIQNNQCACGALASQVHDQSSQVN